MRATNRLGKMDATKESERKSSPQESAQREEARCQEKQREGSQRPTVDPGHGKPVLKGSRHSFFQRGVPKGRVTMKDSQYCQAIDDEVK